ncbi:hypothetical protein ACFL6C_13965 [Myxococcota bacterium]
MKVESKNKAPDDGAKAARDNESQVQKNTGVQGNDSEQTNQSGALAETFGSEDTIDADAAAALSGALKVLSQPSATRDKLVEERGKSEQLLGVLEDFAAGGVFVTPVLEQHEALTLGHQTSQHQRVQAIKQQCLRSIQSSMARLDGSEILARILEQTACSLDLPIPESLEPPLIHGHHRPGTYDVTLCTSEEQQESRWSPKSQSHVWRTPAAIDLHECAGKLVATVSASLGRYLAEAPRHLRIELDKVEQLQRSGVFPAWIGHVALDCGSDVELILREPPKSSTAGYVPEWLSSLRLTDPQGKTTVLVLHPHHRLNPQRRFYDTKTAQMSFEECARWHEEQSGKKCLTEGYELSWAESTDETTKNAPPVEVSELDPNREGEERFWKSTARVSYFARDGQEYVCFDPGVSSSQGDAPDLLIPVDRGGQVDFLAAFAPLTIRVAGNLNERGEASLVRAIYNQEGELLRATHLSMTLSATTTTDGESFEPARAIQETLSNIAAQHPKARWAIEYLKKIGDPPKSAVKKGEVQLPKKPSTEFHPEWLEDYPVRGISFELPTGVLPGSRRDLDNEPVYLWLTRDGEFRVMNHEGNRSLEDGMHLLFGYFGGPPTENQVRIMGHHIRSSLAHRYNDQSTLSQMRYETGEYGTYSRKRLRGPKVKESRLRRWLKRT